MHPYILTCTKNSSVSDGISKCEEAGKHKNVDEQLEDVKAEQIRLDTKNKSPKITF